MKGSSMKMRKGFRKALSLVMAGLMTLSLITVTSTPEKVTAAGESTTYDAASQVNFSTTLGRAVDFGLTAGKISQNGHMETTIATNLFKNGGANNDVDLAGDSPAHFIIGGLDGDSKVVLGKTYNDGPMIYNVETTPAVAEKDSDGKYKYILPDNNCKADIVVKTEEESTIKNNINRMIGHAKDESDAMLKKATLNLSDASIMDATHPPHVYIDLTDEQYDGKAVYINANDNDVLLAALQNTGQLHIKKRSNTVIVFNVKGFESAQLNLNKYFVQVLQDDGTLGEEISSGDQTYSGNDSTHNQDIDREIAQKIIWNVPNATNVRIDNTAGTFLVMDPDAFVSVGSSAGWCVTPGEISTHGEWHYIYHGRSNDVNSNEKFDKEMHFAARKAFTESITNVNEIKTQSLEDGEYTFYFYETEADYNTEGKTPKFTQSNDATSKIKFGILSFSEADFASGSDTLVKHYVIKEKDAGTYKNGVRNTTGEVDIELTVKKKTDGSMSFYVYAKYYLTAEDKAAGNAYKTHANSDGTPIEMSDVEFSLGAFFNEVTGEVGSLKVTKQVKGDLPTSVKAQKTFKVSVTNENNKYIKLDGTASSTNPELTIIDGQTLEFKNLPYGKYKIVEDTTDESINEAGYDLTVSGANGETVEISSETAVSKTITNTYDKITPVSVSIKKVGDDSAHSNGLAGAVFSVSKDGVVQTDMGWTSTTGAETLEFKEEGTYVIHEEMAPNQYKVADDVVIKVKKDGHTLKAYDSNDVLINSTVDVVITDKQMVPNRIGSITINKSIEGDGDETDLLNKLIDKGTYFVIKCTSQTGGNTDNSGNYLMLVDGTSITSGPGAPYTGEKVGEFTSNKDEAHILLDTSNFKKNADGKYSLTLSRIIVEEGASYTYEVEEFNAADNDAAAYTWTVAPATGKNTVSLSSTSTNGTAAFTNTYTEKKGYLQVTKSVTADFVNDSWDSTIGSKWFYFTITNADGKYIDEEGEVYTEKKILKLRKGDTIKVKKALPVGTYTVTEITKDTAKGIDADITNYTFDTSSVTSVPVTVRESSTSSAPVTAELKNVYKRQRGDLKVTKKVVNAPSSMADHEYKIGIKDEDGYFWIFNEAFTPARTERAATKDISGYYSLKDTKYNIYKDLPVGIYTVVENVDDASIAEYNLTITGDKKADGYLDFGEGHHYVVNNELTEVTVVNTYKDIPTGTISVTKTLSGAPDNTKVFKFIVTTENGKRAILDNKGTLGDLANAYEFTITGGNTVEVKNLPLGKYKVKEVASSTVIDGYVLNSSSQTESRTIELAAANDNEPAELINIYEQEIKKGSLTITKAKDTASDEIPADVKFPIKVQFSKAGKYTVTQGTTVTTPDFEADTDVTYNLGIGESVKISDVPVGVQYTVTEAIPSTMTEYTNTGITGEGTGAIVEAGSTVTVTNKRTIPETGKLELTKTIKGPVTLEEINGALKFHVKGPDLDKTYQVVDASSTEVGLKLQTGTDGTDKVYKLELTGIKPGTYEVEETTTDITGKTYTAKYTIGSRTEDGKKATGISVAAGTEAAKIDFEDTYTSTTPESGKLKITKTIKGSVTPKEAAGYLVFTITKDSDTTFTAKTVKLSEFDFDESTGVYTYTMDATPGKYIVEETTYDVDGHEPVSIKYTIDGKEASGVKTANGVTVTSGGESAVNFEDEYKKKEEITSTDKGSLVVRKTFAGDSITDAQKNAVSFSVKKADGTDVAFFTYDKMNGMGDYTITDLEPGDYTVTETQYTVTGMKVTVTYETSTTGAGDKANVSVKTNDTARVNFTNTYTKEEEATTTEQPTTQATTTEEETTEEEDDEDAKGTLVITIYDEKTGDVVPGAKIKVTSPSGKTKSYTTDKNGQVKISNTDAGTYKVTVTDVPDGYTVTENAEVEVTVKKNKVTKAKVKIDKEGSVSVTTRTSKSSAKTGDNVPVVPIAGTLILAIIGLIILIRKRQNA